MKFWEIVRYEIVYQLKRPAFWVYCVLFFGLAGSIALSLIENVKAGDYLFNAPVVVCFATAAASLICLLVVAALAGDAATRDVQDKMDRLLYPFPISKHTYLLGRFFAALLLSELVLAAFVTGLILLTVLPVLGEGMTGPFEFNVYLFAFGVFGIPTLFTATAILYMLALHSRHVLPGFLAAALFFVTAFFFKEVLAETMGHWKTARLIEIGGLTILGELKASLSEAEINLYHVSLSGWLLVNRLIWLSVGLFVLATGIFLFRFSHTEVSKSWWQRLFAKRASANTSSVRHAIHVPQVSGVFGWRTHLYQFANIAFRSFSESMRQYAWLGMLGVGGFQMFFAHEILDGPLGVPLLGTSGAVATTIGNSFTEFVVIALIAFYTGQLVWSERDNYMSEISDAAPVADWPSMLGKFAGIVLLLLAFQNFMLLAGILVQVQHNYYDFDFGVYLQILFGFQLVDYVLFAAVALYVHVLVNHKFIGHLLVFLFFLSTVFAGALHIEHKMLIFGSDAGWAYSEMAGFGSYAAPWVLFKLYWASITLILAILARLLWVRGTEQSIKHRTRRLFKRFTSLQVKLSVIAILLVSLFGSYIFYNTNILHKYNTAEEADTRRASYELKYGSYRTLQQPRLTATMLLVDFYPEDYKAVIKGKYVLRNDHSEPIAAIHLSTASDVETNKLQFDRSGKLGLWDKNLGYVVYNLSKPLQPGDSTQFTFEVTHQAQGFTNKGVSQDVFPAVSYFQNQDWLPALGYQTNRELSIEATRKTHKLGERKKLTGLHDENVRKSYAGSEQIRFEAIVSTNEGQTAVAPGALTNSWVKSGRAYFHYKTDAPIRNIYAVSSATYTLRQAQAGTTLLQLYHFPDQTLNAQTMLHSAKATLAYCQQNFSPYPQGQLKLVEYLGSGASATAFPAAIVFTEDFGAINSAADYRDFDLPFAVTAHEVAHQWWGDVLVPANAEGAIFLTESLAWYTALCVVRQAKGQEAEDKLLQAFRSIYLNPRARAATPLLRATDKYQGYRKGPFALYALREYLGEQRVTGVLQKFITQYSSTSDHLPLSTDLYKLLKAETPDSLQYLLVDLIENNTYWDLTAKNIENEQLTNGKWLVTLEVEANKETVSENAKTKRKQMHDLIEIGVYGEAKNGERGKALYLRQHRIKSGKQVIKLVVPAKPGVAGIDPRHLLIDTKPEDNLISL